MSETQTPPSLAKLQQIVQALEYDMNTLAGGHKPSATAARKKLSQLAKEATALRGECLCFQKAIPTKSRKKKVVEPASDEPSDDVDDIEDVTQDIEDLSVVKPKPRGRKPRR